MTALHQLKVGAVGVVEELALPDEVQHHLMHMGFVPEARVLAVRRAPAGDPTVYAIDGFEIALRRDTARGILISVARSADATAEKPVGLRIRLWPSKKAEPVRQAVQPAQNVEKVPS